MPTNWLARELAAQRRFHGQTPTGLAEARHEPLRPSAQAIFGAIVAALGFAAFVTFYHEFKPGTLTPPPQNEAEKKADSLSPANSIAHDFDVLPKSLQTMPVTSIAEEFAGQPKSVHTVPVGRGSMPLLAQPAPAQQATAAPTPALLAARAAAQQANPPALPSHAESEDVCARYGGHRLDFMRGHHAMWKCVYRTRRQWAGAGR
jgi:hypothetical protein